MSEAYDFEHPATSWTSLSFKVASPGNTSARYQASSHSGRQAGIPPYRNRSNPRSSGLAAPTPDLGMSTSSASKVRAGRRVPHPRHWEALKTVSE